MGQKSSKQAGERDSRAPAIGPQQSRRFLSRDRPRTVPHEHRAVPNPQQQIPVPSTHSTPPIKEPRQGRLSYRPLDRNRGEFRLLKILPATRYSHRSDGYDFDPDIVRCQIEYESIDRIEAVNKEGARSALGRDLVLEMLFGNMPGIDSRVTDALKDGMRSELGERWLPPGFKSYTPAHVWEAWLQTWIWSPLSGNDKHPQKDTGGYLALSYVWNDARTLADVNESGRETTRLFQAGGLSYAQAIQATGLEDVIGRFEGGKPSKSHIIVDGVRVEVGRNLDKALRSLREIPEVQCGKRVWVDSFCINQADLVEKSLEVPRMGQIYGNAERVVSWIGDEEDFSGDILEIMTIVGQSRLTEDDMANFGQWFYRNNIRSDFVLRIAQLLSRPYFSRMWVTQEIVLGNDKAILICGPRRFSTSHLLQFGARMAGSSPTIMLNPTADLAEGHAGYRQPVLAMALGRGLAKLRELRTIQFNLNSLTSGSEVANTVWFRIPSSSFVTDPRDLVYGMLNILPKNLASLLNIDYSERHSYRDVMIDFAIANFTMSQSLSWLLLRPWSPFPGCGPHSHSHGVPPWPSWVPNLGLPFSLAHFNWSFGSNCNDGSTWPTHFTAVTTGSNYDVPLLAVDGFYIDTVSETTTSQANEKRAQQEALIAAPHIADEVAELAGIPPDVFRTMNRDAITHHFPEPPPISGLMLQVSRQHRYGDFYGLQRALSQCFERMTFQVRDESESMFDIPISLLEHGSETINVAEFLASPTVDLTALSLLRHLMNIFGGLDLWGLRLRDLFISDDSELRRRPIPELTVFDRTPGLARLFTTCSGYVGAALCPLRAGDQIYIIPGCGMPVALRPSVRTPNPKAFELLGGVFVPGIMHGEAWQILDENEMPRRPEIIVLA